MLIITRRPRESFMIGDDIVVTIFEVRGCQVRLGISAPKDVPIHREEIYERIQNDKLGIVPELNEKELGIEKYVSISKNKVNPIEK